MIAGAAVVMQICLGVLYTWSVFKKPLAELYHWDAVATGAPYRYSLLFFTIGMIVAGLWQDRKGPRIVGSTGGILLGTGCLLASFFGNTPEKLILTYGVVGGLGVGFAYVTPIATCVKWFPDKRGLIVGLAVMGFGLGTVFFSPILSGLIGTDPAQFSTTIPRTFLAMAAIMYVFVIGAAQVFRVPPAGWKPAGWNPSATASAGAASYTTAQMLGTWQFYVLWVLFALGSSIGLTTIGEAKPYMTQLGDAEFAATWALSYLAVCNAVGRLAWGAVSDRVGRKAAIVLVSATGLLACMVFLRSAGTHFPGLVGICLAGFCLGGFLAIMPTFSADFYGPKSFGLNYGLLFSAYGLSGFIVPGYFNQLMKGFAKAELGAGYAQVFTTLGIAAAAAVVAAAILKKPVPQEPRPVSVPEPTEA